MVLEKVDVGGQVIYIYHAINAQFSLAFILICAYER